MSRTYSRRAVLGVLGAGLAGLTGPTERPSCPPATVSPEADCGGPLSLSGPSSVVRNGTNPRFVCRNEGEDPVVVATGGWGVYRLAGGAERLASGATGETTVLAPGDDTAWVLLLDDGRGHSVSTTATTRYVGPVAVRQGQHAFVVRGERDGARFEAAATFTVE